MKIPALKARIGTWDYYITTLTFKQVSDHISEINDQLHTSSGLRDMIQRSITRNYLSIRDYILHQPERFFNSLVLAVYDSYPDWREIEFKYGDIETYKMGILEFPGKFKIFPVDGQHRVEGIKHALKEDPALNNEIIGAIFVGHRNDAEGMKKTRRLFTTLNRYAKPVKLDDIIALDEDDAAAILTRELLEDYDLFKGNRVLNTKQKAISSSNKDALTSIITFYQANVELFKTFYFSEKGKRLTKVKLEEQLKFRLEESLFNKFKEYSLDFWDSFKTIPIIQEYLQKTIDPASLYRNNETGGNLIFRPVGFMPLIKASIRIHEKTQLNYSVIFDQFKNVNFEIDKAPWPYVMWNPTTKKMIVNNSSITQKLLLYMFDHNILENNELDELKQEYAACQSIADPARIRSILDNL